MAAKCKCGRAVWQGDVCRLCFLVATNPKYAALFADGVAEVPQPITAERWPCVHRGAQIGERECQTCGNKGKIEPVYICTVHGRCMMRKWRVEGEQGIAICLACDARAIPPAAISAGQDIPATEIPAP